MFPVGNYRLLPVITETATPGGSPEKEKEKEEKGKMRKEVESERIPQGIPLLPFNVCQYKAAHNSFDKGPLRDQLTFVEGTPGRGGCLCVELDLVQDSQAVGAIDDWKFSCQHDGDYDDFNNQTLKEALAEIKEWSMSSISKHMPIVIYLDLKHGCSHGDDELFHKKIDEILCDQLGRDCLFTPEDFRNRPPTLTMTESTANNEVLCESTIKKKSLVEIVQQCGWPSIGELLGKFLIVLTGEDLDPPIAARRTSYCQSSMPIAFVDLDQRGAITIDNTVGKEITDIDIMHPYYQQGDRIFLNIERGRGDWRRLACEASLNGFMTRIWKCNVEMDFNTAKDARINFIATDHVLTEGASFTSLL